MNRIKTSSPVRRLTAEMFFEDTQGQLARSRRWFEWKQRAATWETSSHCQQDRWKSRRTDLTRWNACVCWSTYQVSGIDWSGQVILMLLSLFAESKIPVKPTSWFPHWIRRTRNKSPSMPMFATISVISTRVNWRKWIKPILVLEKLDEWVKDHRAVRSKPQSFPRCRHTLPIKRNGRIWIKMVISRCPMKSFEHFFDLKTTMDYAKSRLTACSKSTMKTRMAKSPTTSTWKWPVCHRSDLSSSTLLSRFRSGNGPSWYLGWRAWYQRWWIRWFRGIFSLLFANVTFHYRRGNRSSSERMWYR